MIKEKEIDLEKLKRNYKLGKEKNSFVKSLSHLEIYNLEFDKEGNIVSHEFDEEPIDSLKEEFDLLLLKQVAQSGKRIIPKIPVDLGSSRENNDFKRKFEKIVPKPSNSKTVPKDIIYAFIDKDKYVSRTNLRGVKYENGFVYTTDAHKLIKLKKEYNKDLEGKVIDKNGFVLDVRFPDCESVIPNYDKDGCDFEKEVNTIKLLKAVKGIESFYKNIDVRYKYIDLFGIQVNIDNVLPILQMAVKERINTLKVQYSLNHAVTFSSQGFVGLSMPVIEKEGAFKGISVENVYNNAKEEKIKKKAQTIKIDLEKLEREFDLETVSKIKQLKVK